MKFYRSLENTIVEAIVTVLLVITLVVCLLPLMNVVALSLSSKDAAVAGKVSFWPVDPTLTSYEYLMRDSRFFNAFGVSALRVVLGGAVNLLISLAMAFPLSMDSRRFPARDRYMWLLLFCMLFSAGTVPLYFAVYYTGIMDTIWALVLPGAVPVFNVILLMNFFRNLLRPCASRRSWTARASSIC